MSRIVITGATGWLGRQTLDILEQTTGDLFGSDLFLYSSKQIEIKNSTVTKIVRPLRELVDESPTNIDGVIHLAFLTRDKSRAIKHEEYLANNLAITSTVASFIRNARPKWVVSVSSGAIYDRNQELELDEFKNPYGFTKHIEENFLKEVCTQVGANLVIGRLWGAMGSRMPLNDNYAVSDFIQSALTRSEILIKSAHRVQRRYVNASDFMDLVLRIALSGRTCEFDSGGTLVEIGELAQMIAGELSNIEVIRPNLSPDTEDLYFSRSNEYEALCSEFGIEPSSLEQLVAMTINSHKKLLNLSP